MHDRPFTHLSLFTGILGFDIAAWAAGFETVAFCEIEPFCQQIIRKHAGQDALIFNDVHDVTAIALRELGIGHIDLLTGGFPCQDISAAGKGEGLEGSRSRLWFEMLRVITEVRPVWVVVENSPALRTRGADIIFDGLEQAVYTAWPLVVGADNAGAPHLRKRVFIIACRTDWLEWFPMDDTGCTERRTVSEECNGCRRDRLQPFGKQGADRPEPTGEDGAGLSVESSTGRGVRRGRTGCEPKPSHADSRDGSRGVGLADAYRNREQQSEGCIGDQRGRACDSGQDVGNAGSERRWENGRGTSGYEGRAFIARCASQGDHEPFCAGQSGELDNANDRGCCDSEHCGATVACGNGSDNGIFSPSGVGLANTCSQGLQIGPGQATEWSHAATGGSGDYGREELADPDYGNGNRRTSDVQVGRSRSAGRAPGDQCGGDERCIEPRLGGMSHGLSYWLDHTRWPARRGEAKYAWEPPRVAKGIPNRAARLKAVGNAVVPQVVYPILLVIAEALSLMYHDEEEDG